MKKVSLLSISLLAAFALVVAPVVVFAGEHGGQEHGGHKAMSAPAKSAVMSDSATLLAAAKALKNSDPALSAKLTAMAGGSSEHADHVCHGSHELGGE